MDARSHWEEVYAARPPEQVSWYRPHLETSLALIERAAAGRSIPIIDVGGGASTLVDDLLLRGYDQVTVLDISQKAILAARRRLGDAAPRVRWLMADVLEAPLESGAWEIWHDRALFHFLRRPEQRDAYLRQLRRALKPGGQVIIAGFALEGPARCSGLDVVRYDAKSLESELGERFELIESCKEPHHTPTGSSQQFLYCRFRLT